MSRTEDRRTDAGAEGVCWTWYRHDACVDSIVGMNRQNHLSLVLAGKRAAGWKLALALRDKYNRVRLGYSNLLTSIEADPSFEWANNSAKKGSLAELHGSRGRQAQGCEFCA